MSKVPSSLVGDETGLIKIVQYKDGIGQIVSKYGTQNRELGIERLTALGEDNVLMATRNSTIRLWNGTDNLENVIEKIEGGRIKSLNYFNENIVICTENVSIFTF